MPDEVQKSFVRCFVDYLRKQVSGGLLEPDASESVEVAMQCLHAAFELTDEDEESENKEAANQSVDASTSASAAGTSSTENSAAAAAPLDTKLIDLFEMFQAMYIERSAETLDIAESIKNDGNRLMKDGKYNEALLQYSRAITFDPQNPIFYCNRAAAYIRLGDNDHAITDCKSALTYNPGYGKAYGRLGIAYSNLRRYNEAQAAYTKAIELDPTNQDYRNNLEVARNASSQQDSSMGAIPNLTESLNMMLSNPAIRQLFSNADIDLNQVRNMSQNPAVVGAIEQIMGNLQGAAAASDAQRLRAGGGGGGSGIDDPAAAPPLPGDMLALFQSFITQLSNNPNQTPSAGGGGGGGNNPGDDTSRSS